ncbi:hypothetical protein [Nocardia sp. NPDC020380]|uniref:hypothetical protein n=1 Tax=Nocardia sp. NPDC020380 TaxID=3364309 RepID=UPI00379A03BC
MDEFGDVATALTVGVASTGLNNCLGVAAAAAWGQRDRPLESDDVAIDEQIRRRAIYAVLSGAPPNDIRGVTNFGSEDSRLPTDFSRTAIGLDTSYEIGPDQPPAVMVWGSSATDFALATTWDRTYGEGVWVPDEWWSETPMRERVALAVERVFRRNADLGRQIRITSTSLDLEEVSRQIDEVMAQIAGSYPDRPETQIARADFEIVSPDSLPFSRYHKQRYTVRDQYATQWSATVGDDNGSLTMETLPPVPAIDDPELRNVRSLSWQVELTLVDHEIPGTRPLPNRDLLRAGEPPYRAHIRSSNDGIAFESRRFDLISAGASVEWQLARPMLRFPSLFDWAGARAQLRGLTTSLSTPGAHAELLAGLIGSRDHLADLFAGPLADGLHAFVTATRRSDPTVLPGDQGWIAHGEAFLTFHGCRLPG